MSTIEAPPPKNERLPQLFSIVEKTHRTLADTAIDHTPFSPSDQKGLTSLLDTLLKKKLKGMYVGVAITPKLEDNQTIIQPDGSTSAGPDESKTISSSLDSINAQIRDVLEYEVPDPGMFLRYLAITGKATERSREGKPRLYICTKPIEGYVPSETIDDIRLQKAGKTLDLQADRATRLQERMKPHFLVGQWSDQKNVWFLNAWTEEEIETHASLLGRPMFVGVQDMTPLKKEDKKRKKK